MLIDWVTARLDLNTMNQDTVRYLQSQSERIMRYCGKTGDMIFDTSAWSSIRSDSHQISVRVTHSHLHIMGSPARVIGDGCAVFGAGSSRDLNVTGCLRHMARFVSKQLGVVLPLSKEKWTITRLDITENLLLGSGDEVRDALRILRNCEGGRYRVSQQAGDSVYWSMKSTLRSGKAYHKGPHLRYLGKNKNYTGRQYQAHEIEAADRLLRLELKLARHFFQRHPKNWWELTGNDLRNEWETYFTRMIGGAEMTNDNCVRKKVIEAAPTEGQGRAAYGTWLLIKAEGWERARSNVSERSWYRHLKILRSAGLADADISAGQVVPLRRRVLQARPVTSWHELLAA